MASCGCVRFKKALQINDLQGFLLPACLAISRGVSKKRGYQSGYDDGGDL